MVSALSGESKLWGNSHKKGAGKLVGNFELNPLKGDQSGRGPTFFWPLRETILNFDFMNRVNKTNWKYKIFNICSRTTLKETFTAKYNDVLLRKPSVRFTPLSKTKSIPAPVIWKSPPPPFPSGKWPSALSVYVVVQFYSWLKFYFPLFWGTVMYGNEFKTILNKI